MKEEEIKYLVALSAFAKFNSKSLLKIKRTFNNLLDVWQAKREDFLKLGMEETTVLSFLKERKNLSPDEEWEKLAKADVKVVCLDDDLYPSLLKEIYDPPVLLYYQGLFKKDDLPIAVVGSRRLSAYGKQVIENIVPTLTQNKISIISGLALGADATAHLECLKNNGRTVAVLGSGADKASIYPKQNARLAEQIINNGGLVLSEFPLGTLPFRYNFPARNRIISGLSLGTLIIEATEDSGSLITAKLALEQNRDVYCVPGSIFSPLSKGPNNLLKLGAKIVTSGEDILEELNLNQMILPLKKEPAVPANDEEALILKTLNQEPKHIDKIIKETGLVGNTCVSVLAVMEMTGKIKNIGGMNYVLKN